MDRRRANPLAVQQCILLGLLMVLAAAAWGAIVRQGASANMQMMTPSMGMQAPLFLGLWVTMMIAMMFPSAAPMILTFHHVQASRRQRGESFVFTWFFVAAYLLVWTLAGVVAYTAAAEAELLARHVHLPASTIGRIGGAMLIVAGIYQYSPLKDLCLSRCRTPMTFIVTSWRDGFRGAIRMGIVHGTFCLGCCWLLFVILFPLGIMNVAAMAVVTLLVFAEKTLPVGRRIASIAGAVLVLYGAVVLAAPEALPTMSGGRDMSMRSEPRPTSEPWALTILEVLDDRASDVPHSSRSQRTSQG